MTVISLASLSLLALVVTAAPLPNANDAAQLDRLSLEVQNTVQTLFESPSGQPPLCLGCEADSRTHTHVPPVEGSDRAPADLRNVDAPDAAVPVHFEELHSEEEPLNPAIVHGVSNARGSAVLSLTYAALGVTVGCVFGLLYLKYMLSSRRPLPEQADTEKAEKIITSIQNDEDGRTYFDEKEPILNADKVIQPAPIRLFIAVDQEKCVLQASDSPSESDEEDLNEKFEDAEEPPAYLEETASPHMPRILVQHHPDPELLPLPTDRPSTPFSTPPPTPPRSPVRQLLQMREARTASPTTRPAWSLRAADAPSLGLTTQAIKSRTPPSQTPAMACTSLSPVSRPETPILHVPGAFSSDDEADAAAVAERPVRSRAYRAPVPELDIAFAMQLRPGLGLGSDPAWLVRFLMAMFGWMTVFIGNGSHAGRSTNRHAIA